ncbi:MAG TPA: hypothetical protein VMS88_00265 [Terriglobales bacterium]|nr:hypothetical protein [Terriglobales bacterium]
MTGRTRRSRRRFLQTLGLAGVTSALVAPALVRGQGTPAPVPAGGPAPAPADTTRAAAPAGEISEDAKALAGVIERRYGDHLTPEQLDSIRKDLDGDLQATKRLRAVKLGNADEPDFTFRA